MFFDPFGGDDSFGAYLFERFSESEENGISSRKEEIQEGNKVSELFFEDCISDEIDSYEDNGDTPYELMIDEFMIDDFITDEFIIDDKIICPLCGDDFYFSDMWYLDGHIICPSCIDEVDVCSMCECLVALDYSTYENGELYCNDCVAEKYSESESIEEVCENYVYYDDDDYYQKYLDYEEYLISILSLAYNNHFQLNRELFNIDRNLFLTR